MLRLVYYGNALPASFIVDPSAQFQPGQVAQLTVVSNQVMATVSDGTCPIGIIDDIKTNAFSQVAWGEVIDVPATGVPDSQGVLRTTTEIKAELAHPHIYRTSFQSTVSVSLNENNGVITFPVGTALNFDSEGGGVDSIRTVVNYTYQVPNIPGDDSTRASGRVTVWFERMFFQTDQYETNQSYPLRANLYVSEVGLFTTRRPSDKHPAVATVTAPPTSQHTFLELMWY